MSTAIITANFRKNTALNILNEIQNGPAKYEIRIGKENSWGEEKENADPILNNVELEISDVNPPTLRGSLAEEAAALYLNLETNPINQYEIQPEDVCLLTKRWPWVSGRIFQAWNPYLPSSFEPIFDENSGVIREFPCYTIVNNQHVYICLKAGKIGSHIPPPAPFVLSMKDGVAGDPLISYNSFHVSNDGYVWAYICSISQEECRFNIPEFFPVPLDIIEYVPEQSMEGLFPDESRTNTTGGRVVSFYIEESGTGYKRNEIIVVNGDGTGLDTASTALGQISAINEDTGAIEEITVTNMGANYTWGNADIATLTGSGAKIYPIISPKRGFGYYPVVDLPCWFLGIEGEKTLTAAPGEGAGLSYRQVSLFRNSPDGNERGILSHEDDWQMMYCNNRQPISRSISQQEDIKIIIEF